MSCPRGQSITTSARTKKTQLGSHPCFGQTCKRTFNERTGTSCNYLEFPTDLVLLVVMWRLRYQLSLRDLAAMFLERGFQFTHEAVREWEARFAPRVADQLRAKRKGPAGRSWQVDATSIKVSGVWNYRYRAIDRAGNLVDSMLSEHRDRDAAKRCFQAALAIAEPVPEQVTTAGHGSYPRAIRETLGEEVIHRGNRYLNHRLEQDHRGSKPRFYPMRGFGNVAAASRCCRAVDQQRNYFRLRPRMGQPLPPRSEQRREHGARWKALMTELLAA